MQSIAAKTTSYEQDQELQEQLLAQGYESLRSLPRRLSPPQRRLPHVPKGCSRLVLGEEAFSYLRCPTNVGIYFDGKDAIIIGPFTDPRVRINVHRQNGPHIRLDGLPLLRDQVTPGVKKTYLGEYFGFRAIKVCDLFRREIRGNGYASTLPWRHPLRGYYREVDILDRLVLDDWGPEEAQRHKHFLGPSWCFTAIREVDLSPEQQPDRPDIVMALKEDINQPGLHDDRITASALVLSRATDHALGSPSAMALLVRTVGLHADGELIGIPSNGDAGYKLDRKRRTLPSIRLDNAGWGIRSRLLAAGVRRLSPVIEHTKTGIPYVCYGPQVQVEIRRPKPGWAAGSAERKRMEAAMKKVKALRF